MPPRLRLEPPLLNSATPWATTRDELRELYDSPYTGGVTTRTCLRAGFAHNPRIHQYTLFGNSSLNTYGYSPHQLSVYLDDIHAIVGSTAQTKPFIISITGTPSDVSWCVLRISSFATDHALHLCAEVNLSCPNIAGHPPPTDPAPYLAALPAFPTIAIGLKTPPYTHPNQYTALFTALEDHPDKIAFITATNSLGSALHLSSPPSLSVGSRTVYQPTLSSTEGTGVGGLAGESIHWLSLGNVDTIRRGLDRIGMGEVVVVGVGGVGDADGMRRMLAVGAGAVGVGTALGREGVAVFRRILEPKKEGQKDESAGGIHL